MKKIVLSLTLLFSVFLLSSCDSGQTVKSGDVSSTDLSSIRIDTIQLGEHIDSVDLSNYSERSDLEDNENSYMFDSIRIYTDNEGYIVKLLGDSGSVCSFDETQILTAVDDVTSALGSNYNEYWYDREQQLKALTYTDSDNGLSYTCVFSSYDSEIVWTILSE